MPVSTGKGRGSYPKQMDGSPSGNTQETPGAPSGSTTSGGNVAFVRLTSAVASKEVERKPTEFETRFAPLTERKPDGSPYLVDLFPNICGTTERDSIIPHIPWKVLQQQNVAEWRCWSLIQRWRRFTHFMIRLAFKRRMWGIYGDLLKMFKYRAKGWKHHLDRDFPPGTLPDDGSRERAYPNAKHIDRSKPRPSEDYDYPVVSWTSRHRIMH